MEELVEKARNGDKQAFIEIIISINDYLYKIARTRLYCEDDIEEIGIQIDRVQRDRFSRE